MNAKNNNPGTQSKLRAIFLSADVRPEVQTEAQRLCAEIGQYVQIVRADLIGNEEISTTDIDLAFVLGGDGSILRAVRQMGHNQLPIVAINMGKLGFLANISAEELPDLLSDYQTGRLPVAEHLMFDCSLIRNEAIHVWQLGLNEVAVLAGTPFSLINVNLYVNTELATTYRCDGVLISTPVGSTAHSLSAGGPILRQTMQAFVISPICPHALANRTVVDTADRIYELEVQNPNDGTSAVVDGRVLCQLKPGDRIRVEKSDAKFKLITGTGHGYYQTLRDKLGWGGQLKLNKQ